MRASISLNAHLHKSIFWMRKLKPLAFGAVILSAAISVVTALFILLSVLAHTVALQDFEFLAGSLGLTLLSIIAWCACQLRWERLWAQTEEARELELVPRAERYFHVIHDNEPRGLSMLGLIQA